MWLAHCTAHTAYGGTHTCPCFPPWRRCTGRLSPTSSPARNHSSGPCSRSTRCLPCSPWFLASEVEGTNPSSSWYWGIFLPHQYHSITPRWLRGTDSSSVQHLLNVLPHFLHQWWGDLAESFLEWLVIQQLNIVFRDVCAAYLMRFQREDVLVFQ